MTLKIPSFSIMPSQKLCCNTMVYPKSETRDLGPLVGSENQVSGASSDVKPETLKVGPETHLRGATWDPNCGRPRTLSKVDPKDPEQSWQSAQNNHFLLICCILFPYRNICFSVLKIFSFYDNNFLSFILFSH